MSYEGALKTFQEVQVLCLESGNQELEGLAVGLQELTMALKEDMARMQAKINDLPSKQSPR